MKDRIYSKNTIVEVTKRNSFLFFLLSINTILFSQAIQKEGNIWYFGENGGIDFNTNPPTPLSNGAMNAFKGCSSIADENGNLLMYTDGVNLYGKDHTVIPNGNGLMGHTNSAQSAVIVPKPFSDSIYYIFTTLNIGGTGLRYSEVNINVGTFGEVTSTKNVQLIANGTQRLTTAVNSSCNGIWVITHTSVSDEFYAYEVTDTGINLTPVISTTGPILIGNNSSGCIKVSHDGRYLIDARPNSSLTNTENLVLFDFNNATGEVSNPTILSNTSVFYGVEFSPSNRFLYATSATDIFQYDLTAADIPGSEDLVGQTSSFPGRSFSTTSLELGPDNKIYVANSNPTTLDVINDPDLPNPACNFVNNDFVLNASVESWTSLPQTVPHLKKIDISGAYPFVVYCPGDPDPTPTLTGTSGGTFSIDNSGTIDSISGEIDLSASGPGNYVITYKTLGNCPDSATTNIVITNSTDATITSPGIVCLEANPIDLDAVDIGGSWSGLGVTDTILGIFNPSIAGAGNHQVIYTIPGGCGDTDTLDIVVDELTVSLTQNAATCPGICNGMATVTVVGGTPNYSYNWGSGGTQATDNNLCEATLQMVTVTDLSGCTATDSILIGSPQPLTINVSNDTTICLGDSVIMRAFGIGGTALPDSSGDGYFYEWSNELGNSSEQLVFPQTTTSYFVSVTDSCLTTVEDTITVNVNTLPQADFSSVNIAPFQASFEDLSESISQIEIWNWTFGNFGTSEQQNPSIIFPEDTAGCYEVELLIIDINGCSDTIVKKVQIEGESVAFISNTFTPNGDGINDTFGPKSIELDNYKMIIFDRWGKEIFETHKLSKEWDGTYKDKPVQKGVYVYKLSYESKTVLGKVSLIK